MTAQLLLAQLNGDLAIPCAFQRHLGNRRQLQHPVAQIFRREAQLVLGQRRRRHGQRHDFVGDLEKLDVRLFRLDRREVSMLSMAL